MSDRGWNDFLYSLTVALLALACVFVAVLAWSAWQFQRHAVLLEENADKAVIIVGGAASDLEKTLRQERQQASAQLAAAAAAEQSVARAANSLDALERHTDNALNSDDGLLPALSRLTSGMTPIEAQAQANLADLDASEKQLPPAIAAAQAAVQNFGAAGADLHARLPALLGNTQRATDSAAAVTANLADTSAQLDATAKDVRAFVHRELTPVRGTWHVIKGFLQSFAGPAAQVATAAK